MDEADIDEISERFLRASVASTPSWVERCVVSVARAQGIDVDNERAGATIEEAGERAAGFVDQRLGQLLRTDIDRQRTTPLSVFREAARFAVEALHGLGAKPVHRGDVSRWAFPNDPFAVTPANLADVSDEVQQAGIIWGAAKASLHLQRRRDEGQR